jgi:prepilin-type N-terminal cleavage/methylation domain-containing protein
MKNVRGQTGFTLIEVVMVLVLMAIIGTMTLNGLRGSSDAERWEETRQKMEAIKQAILGDPASTSDTERNRFGYLGDMGRMPGSLTVLTGAEAPAWSFNTYLGIGAGWRGPYYNRPFTAGYGIEQDGWGNAFIYSTTSLTSRGSDNAGGGSNHATDIVVLFPQSQRLASVGGRITDAGVGLGSEVVQLFYPASGAIVASTATTGADGSFVFPTIPFGARALLVTTLTPDLGPIVFAADRPQVYLSPSQADYFGRSAVTLNSATVSIPPLTLHSGLANSETASSDTIALAYTVPPAAGANSVMIAATVVDDNSANVLANSFTYGIEPMYLITAGTSALAGSRVGLSVYALAVTAGQVGTITATFPASVKPKSLTAYTAQGITSPIPEVVTLWTNGSGSVLGSITPFTAGSLILSAMGQDASDALTVSGMNHQTDLTVLEGSSGGVGGAQGHIISTSTATLSTVGWTSGADRMVLVLAAFKPTSVPVTGTISSSYRTDRILDYITIRWTGSELLRSVALGGVTQTVPGVPSGTRIDIQPVMTVSANSTATAFEFYFDGAMRNRDMIVTFEWTNGDKDTVTFTTPP